MVRGSIRKRLARREVDYADIYKVTVTNILIIKAG